jgi:hypothetical protein
MGGGRGTERFQGLIAYTRLGLLGNLRVGQICPGYRNQMPHSLGDSGVVFLGLVRLVTQCFSQRERLS